MKKALFVLLLILFVIYAKSTHAQEPPEYWPTQGWRASSPEQQGIDSQLLTEAVTFLLEQDQYEVHSLLVIRNGYIVTDAAFYPFQAGNRHDVASVTKSFTSTLIGRAIQAGFISNVDQHALEFFPDRTIDNLNADKQAITIENLLMMQSGLACGTRSGELELLLMLTRPDWIQFALDLPMASPPGTGRAYCSPGAHLLQGLIAQATGMTTTDFASQYLFEPLGISDAIWPVDAQGITYGWGELRLTVYDMAKLGFLYLNDGYWEGEQLLPEGWGVTPVYAPPDEYWAYGYFWWLRPDYFVAMGRGGQYIYVFPDQDLIVILTGNGGQDRYGKIVDALLYDYLVPAAISSVPLPDNPDQVALLNAAVQRASEVPSVEVVSAPALPQLAQEISGQTYLFDPNPLNIYDFTLTFQAEDRAYADLSMLNMVFSWQISLDNAERLTPGRFGMPALVKGVWENDQTFVVLVDEIGNNMKWLVRATFDSDKIVLKVENLSRAFPLPLTITGHLQE